MALAQPQGTSPVTLLWTGGWDSTFRLLDLLLVQQRRVQPYYVIDAERPSTGIELLTLRRIKKALFQVQPGTRQQLGAVVFREASDIRPDPALTASFTRLRKQHSIGGQYDWLARFAAEEGLDALELSLAKMDRAAKVLGPMAVPVERDGDRFFEISSEFSGSDEFTVFRRFRLPLLDVSKTDMERRARAGGFETLLEMTWFCQAPRNGAACGVCNPCACAMRDGMARRIPRSGRARYYGRQYVVDPLKRVKSALLARP